MFLKKSPYHITEGSFACDSGLSKKGVAIELVLPHADLDFVIGGHNQLAGLSISAVNRGGAGERSGCFRNSLEGSTESKSTVQSGHVVNSDP